MMVMSHAAGMGDAMLRDRLPALWRRIEDAHYSYLETDDSPEKLQQRKKLEGKPSAKIARKIVSQMPQIISAEVNDSPDMVLRRKKLRGKV